MLLCLNLILFLFGGKIKQSTSQFGQFVIQKKRNHQVTISSRNISTYAVLIHLHSMSVRCILCIHKWLLWLFIYTASYLEDLKV